MRYLRCLPGFAGWVTEGIQRTYKRIRLMPLAHDSRATERIHPASNGIQAPAGTAHPAPKRIQPTHTSTTTGIIPRAL